MCTGRCEQVRLVEAFAASSTHLKRSSRSRKPRSSALICINIYRDNLKNMSAADGDLVDYEENEEELAEGTKEETKDTKK